MTFACNVFQAVLVWCLSTASLILMPERGGRSDAGVAMNGAGAPSLTRGPQGAFGGK
jgi:hypothetical protein